LDNDGQADEWLGMVRDRTFQDQIRALTIQHNGVQYSLPTPPGFGRVFLFAEQLKPNGAQRFKGGERIVCQADDVRVTLMVHEAQRAARMSLSKIGTQCYNPIEEMRRCD
jgi:hypothetical protein